MARVRERGIDVGLRLGLIAALAVVFRLLRGPILEGLGALAGGRPQVVFLVVAAVWAMTLVGWTLHVTRTGWTFRGTDLRFGHRVAIALLGALTVGLLAITPGRRGDERLLADAEAATGSTTLADAFLAGALAGIVAYGVWIAALGFSAWRLRGRDRSGRSLVLRALGVYWIAAVAIGLSVLPSTVTGEFRDGSFLAGPEVLRTTRDHLLAGDAGPLGGFDPGLRATTAAELDCEAAATRFLPDGDEPVTLPGCLRALELRAVGRFGRGEARRDTGSIRALVLQAEGEQEADALLEALRGTDYPRGEREGSAVVASPESFVIVSVEDSADLPRTADGGRALPLHRALGYLMIGETTGLFVAPDAVEPGEDVSGRD